MKLLSLLVRLASWLPIAGACFWASLAARCPEPLADRAALGEMLARWDFDSIVHVGAEPLSLGGEAWRVLLLQLPGMTLQSAAFGNVLLAMLFVVAAANAIRRAFELDNVRTAWVRLVLGLLVCSPAFGVDWLYAQRAGLFLPPLLFVWSLGLLQRERHFAVRAPLALLLAVAAPFCHTHGAVVFVALLPSLLEAARRAKSSSPSAWLLTWLLINGAAVVATMVQVGGVAIVSSGLLRALLTAPLDTGDLVLCRFGSMWLDVLPGTALDDRVFGALSLLLPLAASLFGNRQEGATRQAAMGWSCFWFGLLLLLFQIERHGPTPAVGTAQELAVGGMLLPVGVIVLMAARFGAELLPLAGGVLLVLGLQDWHQNIEVLRQARLRAAGNDAALLLPESLLGPLAERSSRMKQADALAAVRMHKWMPDRADAAPLLGRATPRTPPAGVCLGGDVGSLRGSLRSSLRHDTVQLIVARAVVDGQAARPIGIVAPDFIGQGRDVQWSMQFEALPERARVQVVGLFADGVHAEQLGPWLLLQNGVFVPEGGQ